MPLFYWNANNEPFNAMNVGWRSISDKWGTESNAIGHAVAIGY